MKKIAYVAVAALAIVACNKEGVKVETLTVTPTEKTVYPDELPPVLSLTATPDGALDGKTVEWVSSDPKIVTVASDGTLAFAVADLDEEEKIVTITATVDGKTADCTLTVKEIISKYEVLDFTEEFGFKMLDRNIGAKTKEDTGNYYQWGKLAPVATTGDTEVNKNYDAAWGPESAGFADWTVAENTPCPKGWSLPDDEQMKRIDSKLEIIGYWDADMAEYEDCAEAFAILEKIKLVKCGQFNNKYTTQKYLSDEARYFWSSYIVTEESGAQKIGLFEYSRFPIYKNGGSYDVAVPVRCVKSTATPIL